MNRRAASAADVGFTLIEIVMAMSACAIILVAIYGVFSKAVHLRNDATERTRVSRVRAHAATVIRNDLRGALVSGGTLAATLVGSQEVHGGSFPGYLKFITTTGRDNNVDDVAPNEMQQVEYYLANDEQNPNPKSGILIRATERNLLATVVGTPVEETLLSDIESMTVEFFDGSDWQQSWDTEPGDTTVPQAIRVRLQPTAATGEPKPPAIEVLVPWLSAAATDTGDTTNTSGGPNL